MAVDTNQTMELTQATQTLKWLDEERRKDKSTIAALEERVQSQDLQIAQQAAQIQELQTALANIQGLMSQVTEFRQFVSSYKDEMVIQMDQREEARRKEQSEADRLRRMEYEAMTDSLNRLEKQMRVLSRYDEQLNAQQAESQRLSEGLQHLDVVTSDLNKRSDERIKAVTYLEEQRRADNRRIVDLERDTTDLHKRIEILTTKFPLLEEMLQKQRARIEDAIQETKKFEKPIEELRISDFQREQKMKQYMDQGEQVAQEMERIRTQTQGFIEQQQRVKRGMQKLETFQARLEKQQNEVSEMQRLANDRLKRQWEEWQEGQEKKRQKREVIVEERWRQQERTNDTHLKRLDTLQSTADLHRAQLDSVWESRRADAVRRLQVSEDEYEAHVSQADAQLSALRGEQ